jgi:hypothetical protein
MMRATLTGIGGYEPSSGIRRICSWSLAVSQWSGWAPNVLLTIGWTPSSML